MVQSMFPNIMVTKFKKFLLWVCLLAYPVLIYMLFRTGIVSTIAGSGDASFADGVGAAAGFKCPTGLDIDPGTGDIYVADCGNNRIRKITPGNEMSIVKH